MASSDGQGGGSAVDFEARSIRVGDLEALILDGALRQLRFRGVEVVRGIDCPIRDVNWGTESPEEVEEELLTAEDHALYKRRFRVFDGALSADLRYRFTERGITAELTLYAHRSVETNRAGFSLLHPIEGVAGTQMTVGHPDGTGKRIRFPELISPGQPAFDIAAIRHEVGSAEVDIRFSGEIFEMEDQRNWTDASFKTYCRPLGLGFPYAIEAGEVVTQTIDISVSPANSTAPPRATRAAETRQLPDVAVALEPNWMGDTARATLADLPNRPRLLRVDAAVEESVSALEEISGPVDLEVVVDDTGDVERVLKNLSGSLRSVGVIVDSVTALPRAYLQSYQPDGDWPNGHTLSNVAQWAEAAFPGAKVGVGMLTNFTEFNRHPPPDHIGDFTTYSTTAIVHAGDDLSVFETLEALPQVHASAQALSGRRPVRLGLSSIAMRSNPYGAAVAENPGAARIAMAMHDPRQETVFAAAFAVGAYAAATQCGCARIALAGAGGPFATGRMNGGAFRPYPIHHVVKALSGQSGAAQANPSTWPKGLRGVLFETPGRFGGLLANCSVAAARLRLPGQFGIVMDHGTDVGAADWLERATPRALDDVELPPATVVFLCEGA